MDLKTIFPKASQSLLDANPHLSAPSTQNGKKNDPGANVAKKPRRSMTNAEIEFAVILESMKRTGEIQSYHFEVITLKLADGCRYTPDFLVLVAPGQLRFCEVKGAHVWEDSLDKFKVARQQFTWAEWQLHQRTKDGWHHVL